mgnify:CR=1 FL=1
MTPYNFDFSFPRSGAPVVTLSATGIAFNAASRSLLGFPAQVDIGYDRKAKVIGVCAHNEGSTAEPYMFEAREKDGWVRIHAKDFSRYLEQQTGMKFRDKAKQFIPEFDEENGMLIVILDEEHLK